MKALPLILLASLMIFGCTREEDKSDPSEIDISTLPRHLQEKIQKINYLDTAAFAKAGATISAISKKEFGEGNPSEHQELAEKFCKKSKGYQNGIWEGENDCSWAVEKNKLEHFSSWIKRMNDTLVIQLKNGERKVFFHNRSNPDQILYYQLKYYLPNIDFIVVEAIQKEKCRISYLVNASDGASFPLNGSLYFSKEQNAFLAASFNFELPQSCTNKMELYKIADQQLEKVWHIPTGDWGVTQAKFVNETEFLIEQSTTGIPPEYNHYAKVTIN